MRDGRIADVRITGDRIDAVGALPPQAGEHVVDAQGRLLLPGLHDHHIHCVATAAARASVPCGPPDVQDATMLAARLAIPGTGWLRGIGYHESVAGTLDRHWLDAVVADRPVRIQHRTGRLWIFNSAGMHCLLESGLPPPPGLDRQSGHLFDEDAWMRRALGGTRPSLAALGVDFARLGVTGLTEISPTNGMADARWLAEERDGGALPQRVLLAGTLALSDDPLPPGIDIGPVKIHLHEAHLPDHDELIALIRCAHGQGRGVAVHCVTEVELVYTLAALREAGPSVADRIEHASVTPDTLLAEIAAMGIGVVSQPLFVRERGDAYRHDIPEAEWHNLYRLRAFLDAGVPLAGSSDAPYGGIDPWAAMAAAVDRRTRAGARLGEGEALTPEEALALYLADPVDLRRERVIAPGAPADLCLLDRPWVQARGSLSAVQVCLTVVAGRIIHGTGALLSSLDAVR